MPNTPTPTPDPALRNSLLGCGMAIFLSSLSMLFLAGMLGLVYLHVNASAPPGTVPPPPLPLGEGWGEGRSPSGPPQGMPPILWLSTLLLILGSLTISRAAASARAARQRALQVWLIVTAALAVGFLVNQVPALAELLDRHFELLRQVRQASDAQPAAFDPRRYLFGLIFFLIVVHALHVLGGLVALTWATVRAFGTRPAPGTDSSVRFTAVYWHFLGVVWLVMFAGFLIL
jgi:heme/copper-type cytochrome/quinol oxidase subunit 3